jgi:cytochrome c-type biogenesis protein CcmF
MVQEKKTCSASGTAFGLARILPLAFGTFLTRSGVLSSIHSFAQSSIGPWFLGFIAVAAAFSTR